MKIIREGNGVTVYCNFTFVGGGYCFSNQGHTVFDPADACRLLNLH